MFEKVNPSHPDKIADRIAGAIVDLAYGAQENPKVAVEVLIGHGTCHSIIETSAPIDKVEVAQAINRIAGNLMCNIVITPQDTHLARNQADAIRCGDNGIFKGMPITREQNELSVMARDLYKRYPFDGKFNGNGHVISNFTITASGSAIWETVNGEAPRRAPGAWRGTHRGESVSRAGVGPGRPMQTEIV